MSTDYTKSCKVYNNLYNECINLFDKNKCYIYYRFLKLHCVSFSKK